MTDTPITVTQAFEREERFIVIKRKGLSNRNERDVRSLLETLCIPTVECVVVESDWPEYETVWKMIEARTTHAPSQPTARDEKLTPEEAWHDLLNKSDRTSPEECPDMALITFDELEDYMNNALRQAPDAHQPPSDATSLVAEVFANHDKVNSLDWTDRAAAALTQGKSLPSQRGSKI